MNLSVKIGTTTFNNPVTVASGTFGLAEKYLNVGNLKRFGAITPKTVTFKEQQGNAPLRIIETPSGMVNAIGIENPGIDRYIINKLPPLQKVGVPLIISILGRSPAEFAAMAAKLDGQSQVKAIELNLSCPNLQKKSLVAQDPKETAKVVSAVKRATNLPVLAKLAPNVTDITQIAKAAEDAGADGISMINTFSAMVIDTKTRRSKIGNFTGGLSGPAIRPIAVNMVYQTAQAVKIPIVAMGGIATADDALQFLIAGATMVAVGTYNFIDPSAPVKVVDGIRDYMKQHKIDNIKHLIGSIEK
ncbi:MAG: dihydroorotate dehydrogenase (NAD+) catalytic subunit [Lysobacterales bacterium]|jgi:dihydroorotate dehydrogenase (NAD+) catalytic subunit